MVLTGRFIRQYREVISDRRIHTGKPKWITRHVERNSSSTRHAGVSERWPQDDVHGKSADVPYTVLVGAKKGRLIMECDEL